MGDKTLNERVSILETQVSRITDDIESETATRIHVGSHLDERLRKLENIVYMATGALAVLQILLTLLKP